MITSPCRRCEYGSQDKNRRACLKCEKRVAYVEAMDRDFVPCRSNHVHADFFIPRGFARQIGPVGRWSNADLIPT